MSRSVERGRAGDLRVLQPRLAAWVHISWHIVAGPGVEKNPHRLWQQHPQQQPARRYSYGLPEERSDRCGAVHVPDRSACPTLSYTR